MIPDAIVSDSPVPSICNTIVATYIADLRDNPEGLRYRYLITCMKGPPTLVIPFVYTDIILMGVNEKRVIKIHTITGVVYSHTPFTEAVTASTDLGPLESKFYSFVELPNIFCLEEIKNMLIFCVNGRN